MNDPFYVFIGIVGGIVLAVAAMWYSGGFDLKLPPETGAVWIHCEGDRDYVAPKDKYYVQVRSGRIYIYENGTLPHHPVMIIKRPTCAINWNAEPVEQPTEPAAPPLPHARTLEDWL